MDAPPFSARRTLFLLLRLCFTVCLAHAQYKRFAGSRHDPDTPVIKRILAAKSGSSAGGVGTVAKAAKATRAAKATKAVKKEEDEEEEDDDGGGGAAPGSGSGATAASSSDASSGAGGGGGGDCPVLLMCRVQPGPYVLCGRVAVGRDAATGQPTGHDPAKRPLRCERKGESDVVIVVSTGAGGGAGGCKRLLALVALVHSQQ